MRLILVLSLVCAAANAQPGWRGTLMGFPAQPSGANIGDIQRFESSVRSASPYFSAQTPADYAANRLLMRQMVGYLGAVDLMARDPQTRAALARAYYALAALRWGYPLGAGGGAAPPPPPPGKPGEPPFERHSPEIQDVAAADKATADELRARYDTTVTGATRAWTNAETIRIGLEGNGMTMNAQTATSVCRLQLYLELAAGALRARDWTEAKDNLEKTEYETEKVFRAVGR